MESPAPSSSSTSNCRCSRLIPAFSLSVLGNLKAMMPDSGRPALTKSCQACVIAKRKCSRTLPQFQRCRDKDIICKYGNEPFSTDNNSTKSFRGSHSNGPTPADSINHDQRRGLVLATTSNSTVLSLDYMLLNTQEVILTFD